MSDVAILVTGGAGYIGSHVCKHLSQNGFLPVTLDNLSIGHADAVQWGPLITADVRDTDAVRKGLAQHQIGAVMHFAASAYVGESVSHPAEYYDNNVGGMISLLTACRDQGVRRFILSSSCATYGMPDTIPIREDSPQHPVNPYGRTKLICEWMLADFDAAYGMAHVILRYFNAAGADPDGELRERHDPETHLIPLALTTASGRRDVLDIYGDDYDTKDGTCLRDYIHVRDLAAGHLAALSHLMQGRGILAVNLGSGKGFTVREIADAIQTLSGASLPIRMRPRRAGDPPALLADTTLAEQIFGFKPVHSALETILRDAAPGFGLDMKHGKTG